jgi:hypothetical protein
MAPAAPHERKAVLSRSTKIAEVDDQGRERVSDFFGD